MDEATFINTIDCAFPYENEEAWRALVIQGAAISDNAAFAVLHEMCRAPRDINTAIQYAMLEYWQDHFAHPVSRVVIEGGKAIISRSDLSTKTVIEYMEHIRPYYGLYAALAITYFACDDTTGEVDERYNEIIAEWQK